jgi:hypothetical protein
LNLHGHPPEPKSGASANSATAACLEWKYPLLRTENFPYDKNKTFPKRKVVLESEASGIRTPDNLIKSQVLYHLS